MWSDLQNRISADLLTGFTQTGGGDFHLVVRPQIHNSHDAVRQEQCLLLKLHVIHGLTDIVSSFSDWFVFIQLFL